MDDYNNRVNRDRMDGYDPYFEYDLRFYTERRMNLLKWAKREDRRDKVDREYEPIILKKD